MRVEWDASLEMRDKDACKTLAAYPDVELIELLHGMKDRLSCLVMHAFDLIYPMFLSSAAAARKTG